MNGKELAVLCSGCGAECCRYISLEIDQPNCRSDYDNVRWYLLHRNVNVFESREGEWCVEFMAACNNLDKNNICTNYENRPRICKEHGNDGECEGTAKHSDELYKHFFSSVDEFDEYLRIRRKRKKKKSRK